VDYIKTDGGIIFVGLSVFYFIVLSEGSETGSRLNKYLKDFESGLIKTLPFGLTALDLD